jgi:hypothetical protein
MKNTRAVLIWLPTVAALTGAAAAGSEIDVFLQIVDGQIVTGQVDASTGTPLLDELRVFPASFGESAIPNFTNDPGFFALPGTFAPGSQLSFNILAPVLAWNGDGFDSTGSEFIRITFSSLSTISGDGFVPGFSLFVQPDGGYHRHLNFFLDALPGPPAQPGIYLLELEKTSTMPGIAPSLPFWIVFNYQASEGEHDAAIAWVESELAGNSCPADLNDDGVVSGLDLATLLGAWGPCPVGSDCPADLDGNGSVNGLDLASLLGAWGACL